LAYLRPLAEQNLQCCYHALERQQLQQGWRVCLLVLLLCPAVNAQWPLLICRRHWQCQQQQQQQST
jgi:hypothetical protein